MAAAEAALDVAVTYNSAQGNLCNGTASINDAGGCETCSQCWVTVNASFLNHANGAYESRINSGGYTGDPPWTGANTYGRNGFLRANCGEFDYVRVEVRAAGGEVVIFSRGVTLICGCD